MKKLKNILAILATLIIVTFTMLSTSTFALSNSVVSFKVVSDKKASIDLNSLCKFEKSIYSSDLKNKQVTIQLKVDNNADLIQPKGEVMLVIDNSNSMTESTSSGKTRKELVFESAKSLVDKILYNNSNVKVGVVSFSTNTDVSKEGTLDDAQLISNLSTNTTELKNSISNIVTNGPRTDLDSGVTLAKKYFTTANTKKYIIILTDGVPNVAIGYNNPYYSQSSIDKTKATLKDLTTSNINLVTMLTGITIGDSIVAGQNKTYNQIISEIFGSQTAPTAGKFYYISDSDIENTIKTTIYNDLLPIEQKITNLVIKDYFPQNIIDNFDFAYAAGQVGGTITPKIDTKDNSITWTIPTLTNGNSFKLYYTLKLKTEFNSEIVGKALNTNQKVDLSYNDFDNTAKTKTTTDTPQVQVDYITYKINHFLNDSTTPFATQDGNAAIGSTIKADDYSDKYTLASSQTTLTISETGDNILNVYWKVPTILPAAGLNKIIPIVAVPVIALGIYSFIKIRKYSGK